MSDIPFFCEQLRKGHSDDPWHGPAIADLLADVTAGEAAAHRCPERTASGRSSST